MPYKDILVYLDDGASNAERIGTAFSLAEAHNARLTGVTLSALKPTRLKVADSDAFARIAEQEAIKRIKEFEELGLEYGITVAGHVVYSDTRHAAKKLAQYARNFDLLILRQANPKNRNFDMIEEVAEKVLLLSGRPVFFMPYIGAHRIPCKKAMIAWDGTPAATRAVHNVLPMLRGIDQVIILVVREGKKKTAKGELLADDLCAHLGRHDVNASVKRINAGTFDVATVILNEIADNDIDLMVMGGYGTPNLKQKIFGGVTKTLLSTMITPVVMSH